VPTVVASRGLGTTAATIGVEVRSVTKTGFVLRQNTIPVAGETSEFNYVVIG
jgi:hypothetical protein